MRAFRAEWKFSLVRWIVAHKELLLFSFIFLTFTFPSVTVTLGNASTAQGGGSKVPGVQVYASIPDFSGSLANVDDLSPVLKDHKDKKVVLYFWSIYCASCKPVLKDLEQVRRALDAQNAELIAVHLFEDEFRKVQQTLRRFNVALPVVMASNEIRDRYEVRMLPTYLVLDEQHRPLTKFEGNVDAAVLLAAASQNQVPKQAFSGKAS